MKLMTIDLDFDLPDDINIKLLDGHPVEVEFYSETGDTYLVMIRDGELAVALDLDSGCGEDSDGGTPVELPEGDNVTQLPLEAAG